MKETTDRRGRVLLNRLDKFVDYARETSSRGAAFIYAIFGVIAQIAHNALLAYDVSLYESEILRVLQAIVIAMAISFALLYSVLTSDGKEKSVSMNIVWTFYVLEVFLNMIYYMKKVVFDVLYAQVQKTGSWDNLNWSEPNWFMLLIGLPFAIFIPFIIKSYAGTIDAHKPALALDDDDFVKDSKFKTLQDELQSVINTQNESIYQMNDRIDKMNSRSTESTDEHTISIIQAELSKAKSLIADDINEAREILNTMQELSKHKQTTELDTAQIDSMFDTVKPKLDELIKSSEDKISTITQHAEQILKNINSVDTSKLSESIKNQRDELDTFRQTVLKRYSDIENVMNSIKKNMIVAGSTIRLSSGDKQMDYTVNNTQK